MMPTPTPQTITSYFTLVDSSLRLIGTSGPNSGATKRFIMPTSSVDGDGGVNTADDELHHVVSAHVSAVSYLK